MKYKRKKKREQRYIIYLLKITEHISQLTDLMEAEETMFHWSNVVHD